VFLVATLLSNTHGSCHHLASISHLCLFPPPPPPQARLDILRIHSRKMNLTRGINLRKVAEGMPGSSGAEVKGVCTEAGMYALRERRVHVTQEDFEMAVAKVRRAGPGLLLTGS